MTVFRNIFPTLFLICLLLCGCMERSPIRIGFLGTISGRHSDLGVSGRDGAQLAIEEINGAGGVGGRMLELIVRDDEGKAEVARQGVKELVSAGVHAIVGPMSSAMAMATVSIVDRSSVVMVSPTVSTPELKGRMDNFIRIYPSSEQNAGQLADHLRRVAGVGRMAIVYDTSNLSHTLRWSEAFRSRFQSLGGTVSSITTFDSSTPSSYRSIAGTVLESHPEAVLVLAGAVDTAMICQQLRKFDPHILLAASEWSATPELIIHGGKSVEGILFLRNIDEESDSPSYRRFMDAYEKRYRHKPDFGAIYAYQAVYVISRGLSRSRGGMPLRDAMAPGEYFRGEGWGFTLDRFGDAERRGVIMTVEQGEFRRVEKP